jgi:hypothetical protein
MDILRRKQELAAELEADWFIHHDADEFRESPWADVSLKDAIRRVDALGYNAIDFASLDFRPTHDRFRSGDDIRAEFPFYSEGAAYDKIQIRCWKKTQHVDLASSGGHEAQFDGRNVFPIRFISRHYPVRGQAHGERKVFVERRPRFSDDECARGWHVQYDSFVKGTSFIHDPCTLTRYDPAGVRIGLSQRHRGVEALEASLDTVRASLEAARSDIEARTRDVERLQEEVRLKTAESSALRRGLEQREAELGQRQAELHDVRAQLVARTSEVANLKDALIDHRRRLDAFERSLSWRWTAPARAIYRLLGGS